MFNAKDLEQIRNLGISEEQIDWQLETFREGIPFMKLNRPATPGDGVICTSPDDERALIKKYEASAKLSKLKFVPASGAASRMFKSLFEHLESGSDENPDAPVKELIERITDFAFFDDLELSLEESEESAKSLIAQKKYTRVLQAILGTNGLNYGSLPKGLLKFHSYESGSKTAFEEHLTEAGLYAAAKGERASLHFTVSPEHLEGFRSLLSAVQADYEARFGIKYEVSFSIQKPSTDTMAVGWDNRPFRNPDDSILFRPGGHGALIHNLNELDADLIFIKNIDNVVRENFVEPTIHYKKVLGGKLIELQSQVHGLLQELESGDPGKERMQEILGFIRTKLCYEPKEIPDSDDPQMTTYIKKLLNRPIRVCGVVKNLGEPGGGPFWAPNSKGDISLQIIESSQVDTLDIDQKGIFSGATHFNPVDLVCGVRDFKGNKFDLSHFVDPATCFISKKSKDGKDLKALELPGLWNGAMADWITVFIEVPVETFNPVKTVNDLLRPAHQEGRG